MEPPVQPLSVHEPEPIDFAAEQRFGAGIAGGFLGAAIGAGIWAAVTIISNYQIGYMAVAVGALAGFGTRFLGRGIDTKFGVVGAAMALLGCLIGNYLAAVGALAGELGIGFTALVFNVDSVELMTLWFEPMDLLFYGIAVYEGYRFAFRPIPEPGPMLGG